MIREGFHGLQILQSYKALMRTAEQKVVDADLPLLKRAFQFAHRAHREQKRLSGEPYITHPLAVARILAEQHLDSQTIAAALLHDVVEDTRFGEDYLKREFGEEISNLVKAVTKISSLKKESQGSMQRSPDDKSQIARIKERDAAENIRLMLLATARDVRVILIKLADKLHNMRTLEFQKNHKVDRIANEVLHIYAPIAGRLGMYRIKSELEDLAFAGLHPDDYLRLTRELKESRSDLEEYIKTIRKILKQRLAEINIQARVEGRAKHFYSLFNKMRAQHKDLDEIYDLRGVRIIVNEVRDCYGALGIVHTLWMPIPGRFKDYIATPKINGYQSLHTTVVGLDGKPLEVQIRTHEMDEMADHGIAAHWIYKSQSVGGPDMSRIKWLHRLSRMVDPEAESFDFIEDLRHELDPEEVYVFTPRGDVIDLPMGATAIDFAFRIHTDVGLRCKTAKVNDRIVPLRTELKSGDRVEVITEKHPNPSPNWLRYIRSPGARQKLRAYFRRLEEESQPASERERDSSHDAAGHSRSTTSPGAHSAHSHSHGSNNNADDLQNLRIHRRKTEDPKRVEVAGEKDIPVRYAGCCTPVPGDRIIGFVTRGRGVTVHRADCQAISQDSIDSSRIIPVRWEGLTEKYPVEIEVRANDRQGLYLDLVGGITRTYTNILKAEADIPQNGSNTMTARFLLEVEHVDHLREIVESLEGVGGVNQVVRLQSRE